MTEMDIEPPEICWLFFSGDSEYIAKREIWWYKLKSANALSRCSSEKYEEFLQLQNPYL